MCMYYTNIHIFEFTVIVNLLAISYGCCIGWLSGAIPQLQHDDSLIILDCKFTMENASWMAAILFMGAICSLIVATWMAKYCGLKIVLMLLSIPIIVSITIYTIVVYLKYCISEYKIK